ncbi:hypothetical protein AL345_19560 [Aeromonas caviae]|nr:hypothetical protein AL345_19560 [Aeromonas caviae]
MLDRTTCAVLLLVVGALLALTIIVPMDVEQQMLFSAGCMIAALVLRRASNRLAILAMVVLSVVASLRYMYWRLTSSLGFDNWLNMLFGYGLVLAELYALVVLLLGYLQTAWPLQRKPYPLPADSSAWPTVDVFIPTYNEPLDIIKLTSFAAQAIDWPKDKLRVYVLDDGRRDEFREFCESVGIGYIIRPDNNHAKAGNLNFALTQTSGEYVAIFDADHVPTRSFLQVGMGWFLKDPKLAMLQTPHFFFSPDPFEKNLETFRSVPNEGELFYGLVQDGNDLWNATFFCGSCAIIKRGPLEEVGGIAVETVTEDAHTAQKLNRLGYNTAYLAIPQAAGLATESLSGHIGQRIRWARGMAQIFRTDNPLLGKGLSLGQRFCYLNAMLHFFYGLPRMVFLTAPLAYLLFEAQIFQAPALLIVAYALPHILLASVTNSTIQGRFRHSFWNEVYESVLAWYIMRPVLLAMINPKLGKFNVTAKGGVIDESYFDWKMARPYIVVLALNFIGMLVGVVKLGFDPDASAVTLLINLVWTLYNIIVSSAAVAVASEARQIRAEPRVSATLPAMLGLANGKTISCHTNDFSQRGVGINLPEGVQVACGEQVHVSLFRDDEEGVFPASVVFSHGQTLGLNFVNLTLQQQSELARLTFSRADTWAKTWGTGVVDTPLGALAEVTGIGWRGICLLSRATFNESVRHARALSFIPIQKRKGMLSLWFALSIPLLTSALPTAWAEDVVETQEPVTEDGALVEEVVVPEFVPTYSATLKQLGANYPMNLRGIEGSDSVSFGVRADQVVTKARVNLEYSYSPSMLSDLSQINVMVNDQVAASLPVPKETAGTLQQQVVDIPAHLVTEFNRLTLQLIGHYTMMCEDPLHSSLWAKVSNTSQLELETTQIALPDDLARLPLPFFDGRDSRALELPFVFASSPDNRTLEAAGAVASWFGALASYRGARFPVSLGQLPEKGHAIVLMVGSASMAGIELPPSGMPTLSMIANPNDPFGKLLVIAARDADQLKQAALTLVSGSKVLAGASAQIERFDSLQPREPYDAPNWLPSDRPVQLGELSDAKRLSVSGYNPGTISIPMRLPPDLFNWREKGVPLHLKYRYTPQPVSTNSSMLISVSDKFIKSLPLPSQESLKDDESLLAKLQQDETLLQESKLLLPLDSLPLQSALQMRFMYDYIKQGECRDIIIDNMRGTIEADSTLDLSGYEHFIAMPNLGVFQSSGFPFTRMADLSETAVVMPVAAAVEEISLYLDVMGRFGDSTGLPASAVSVTQGDQDEFLEGKDLLVLASGSNQPLLQRWADRLPASMGDQSSFELSDLVHRVRTWVGSDTRVNQRQARSSLALASGGAGAYLTGFESPLDSGRSVVVIAAASPDKLVDISSALRGGEDYEESIQGSLAVINGKRISSLVADEQYYVGELGWLRYLQWLLAHNLFWMLLLTAVAVSLASLLLFFTLRARARARLND